MGSTRWGTGLIVCVVAGCSSPSSKMDDAPQSVSVTGAAAKGPLLAGSPITVHMIDAAGNPTGVNYNTTTKDDLGRFDLVVMSTGDAELQADGFYFNEMTGGLSTSQITLFALAPIASSSGQQIYINAYTHMSEARAKKLMANGMAMPAAIAMAETELRNALGLFVPGTLTAGTSLDILGADTDANAYLLALSCTLAQGSGGSDANLQQLVNNIALDLAPEGMAMVGLKANARRFMDAQTCIDNLTVRLMQQPTPATLPNIDRALDFDDDGIADFADPDADGDGVPAAADKIIGGAATVHCGFALDSAGWVWGWNGNESGSNNDCVALGDGTNISHRNPLPIPGLTAAQIAISNSNGTTMYAVKADGALVSWRSFAAPTAVTNASGLRITPGTIASDAVNYVYLVKADGTMLQILMTNGATPPATALSGVSGVLAAVNAPQLTSNDVLVIQNTDGSIAVMTVSGTTPSTVAVTGVSGVTTPGAISATQNFGYAISNGDVYSFPVSGSAIAATKVNGLPANGVISLSAGYAIDSSGQSWDISTPSAPAQFLSDVVLIPKTGAPMLFIRPDGSMWMVGQSAPRSIRIPR